MPDSSDSSQTAISTWQDAEHAAAKHMREILSFTDVRLSRAGADNGIDVKSREGIAQVKWYRSSVGIAEVQRLRGTTSNIEWALFYSSVHGYTKSAKEAATRGNVALFTIRATGLVVAANHVGESLERMRRGLPQQKNESGEVSLGEKFTTYRRHWELNAATRVFERRVRKILHSVSHMQSVLFDLERNDPEAAEELRQGTQVWPAEANPASFEAAATAFRKAIEWDSYLPDGGQADLRARTTFQEEALPKLPALVKSLIESTPVSRALLNGWCDRWSEAAFRAQYQPRRRMPQDGALLESLERRISRGPDKDALDRHAELMAIRVVV